MHKIDLAVSNSGKGIFHVDENGDRLAEMFFHTGGNIMTVYHTEVFSKAEGKGIGTALLHAMTAYARKHKLQVDPTCAFVQAQFRRHPEQYADIWKPQ